MFSGWTQVFSPYNSRDEINLRNSLFSINTHSLGYLPPVSLGVKSSLICSRRNPCKRFPLFLHKSHANTRSQSTYFFDSNFRKLLNLHPAITPRPPCKLQFLKFSLSLSCWHDFYYILCRSICDKREEWNL